MNPLLSFLLGSVQVQAQPDKSGYANLLNCLHNANVSFWGWSQTQQHATFWILRRDAKRLCSECQQTACTLCVCQERGLAGWLRRYRFRYGVLVGILLFFGIVFASGRFVWEVRITGNETVPCEEIQNGLQAVGCGIGSYIPALDGYELCKKYLAQDERIAWISVNIIGNVAHVSVKENVAKPQAQQQIISNLVANEDGVIVSHALSQGQSMVDVGDTVLAGELLVSGLVENKNGTYTPTEAKGAVYARVNRILEVEVPNQSIQSERAERVFLQKSLFFFGKEIKFFKKGTFFSKNSGNFGVKYDTIREEKKLTLFGKITLPVWTLKIAVYELQEQTVTNTPQVQQAKAQAEMEQALNTLSQSAQILQIGQIERMETEDALRLRCQVVCIVDIAKQQPIDLVRP